MDNYWRTGSVNTYLAPSAPRDRDIEAQTLTTLWFNKPLISQTVAAITDHAWRVRSLCRLITIMPLAYRSATRALLQVIAIYNRTAGRLETSSYRFFPEDRSRSPSLEAHRGQITVKELDVCLAE